MDYSKYLSSLMTETILPSFLNLLQSEKTKNNYLLAINEYCDFTKKDILISTVQDASKWQNHMKQRQFSKLISYNTVLKKQKQLSSLYSFISKKKEIYDIDENFINIFELIPMAPAKECIQYNRVPSLTELDKLIGNIKAVENYQLLIAVLLSFKSLLSFSDFYHLKMNDFFISEDNRMYAKIDNTKANNRYCLITDDVANIINQFINMFCKDGNLDRYLFQYKSNLYSYSSLAKQLSEACLKSGIKKYTYRDLRNAGITFAISNNADVSIVAKTAGLQTNRHIDRLTSLNLELGNAGEYINIYVK